MTGLPTGIPVLGGLFDVNSCMLGAGAVDASRFSMTAGTWGINAIPSAAPVRSESITQCCRFYGGLPYVCIDSAPTSCTNLEWFARRILQTDRFDQVSEAVRRTAVDETLLYLPYLYAPMDLPSASGGFVGLRAHHTRTDLTRAVFEGIVFEHRRRMEKLQAIGLDAKAIVLSGGAANSTVFAKLFADICGKEVFVPAQSEAGAMGGVIGSLQAMEANQVSDRCWRSLNRKLLTFDALKMEFHTIKLPKADKHCAICGEHPTITELIDYEQVVCEDH